MTLWWILYSSRYFWKRVNFSLRGGKTVDEFGYIINLDTLDCTGEGLFLTIYKLNGEIGAVFLKNPHETPAGILVGGPVLKKLFSNH